MENIFIILASLSILCVFYIFFIAPFLSWLKWKSIQFTSNHSLSDISIKLTNICNELRAETSPLETINDFGVKEEVDIAVLAQWKKFFGGEWGVQIWISEEENECFVELVALWENMAAQAIRGWNNSIELKKGNIFGVDNGWFRLKTSKKICKKIREALT
jgi:hypothetical protein